jgi:hypothetical protein
VVTRTYSDAGKSGLVIKRRDGLRQLLNDVVGGKQPYKAILVYDVSRWGRFQDVDEAAHYEFLCKAAGVEVHYCAEQFANDNSLASAMMKALKRVMAGEYSRELSVKVNEGSKRIPPSSDSGRVESPATGFAECWSLPIGILNVFFRNAKKSRSSPTVSYWCRVRIRKCDACATSFECLPRSKNGLRQSLPS